MNQVQFSVAMLGARMHYAVPQIFAERGRLAAFFTDLAVPAWCAGVVAPIFSALGSIGAGRAATRTPPRGVEPVISFPLFGLEYMRRLKASRGRDERSDVYLWAGHKFGSLVTRRADAMTGAAYAFSSAALEILGHAEDRRCQGVLEQASVPRAKELSLLSKARTRFPEWADDSFDLTDVDRRYVAREREEWKGASLVVTPSEFAAEALEEAGCDPGKLVVVPYGVESPFNAVEKPQNDDSFIKVVFVGKITLAKGAPVLEVAARALKSTGVVFRAVGAIDLPETSRRRLAECVELVGQVPRTAVHAELADADIFAFPSFCEGSATVCYEALAAGLPVVTTPNAGSVVRDGVEGFIVPAGDVEAFTERIHQLVRDRDLRRWMADNARRRAEEFTVRRYGERLIAAIDGTDAPEMTA
jgi:glycosyltransferase involved in cell wall biosynthesis